MKNKIKNILNIALNIKNDETIIFCVERLERAP